MKSRLGSLFGLRFQAGGHHAPTLRGRRTAASTFTHAGSEASSRTVESRSRAAAPAPHAAVRGRPASGHAGATTLPTPRTHALEGEEAVAEAVGEFETVGTRHLPPDPAIMKAIGLNHAFESAIADLVDNSIDAEADRVLIRFVLQGGLINRLLVVDNGRGMDASAIDAAMQLGRAKKDSHRALGHFGMGLKSATFSQASVLTVLSRTRECAAQGRRMRREATGSGFECDLLAQEQVEAALNDHWPRFATETGTIVRWDDIRTFPASSDRSVTDAYLEAKQSLLRHHLGLMFHRLLENDSISISIDVFDADAGESGFVFDVEPIDPFGYVRSGVPGYPKKLTAHLGSREILLECHIWPGGSDSPYFKLASGSVESYQGFYLYRNDRLLSAGGWGGVAQETKRRKLARVSIDIEDHLDAFTMSMEKSGVRMVADLVRAIEIAESADGETFQSYLATAERTFQESNRRTRKRTPILPPGSGLSPKVKRAIARETTFVSGEDPLEIRWKSFSTEAFIEVDTARRILWLNNRYRDALLRGGRGGLNDAPLVKALLFLLYEDVFRGTLLGPRDRDNISMWGEILTAAAEVEAKDSHD